jgi:hypothetical protein
MPNQFPAWAWPATHLKLSSVLTRPHAADLYPGVAQAELVLVLQLLVEMPHMACVCLLALPFDTYLQIIPLAVSALAWCIWFCIVVFKLAKMAWKSIVTGRSALSQAGR